MKKIIYFFYISFLVSQIDTTVVIDASNYSNWIYFSFEQGSNMADASPSVLTPPPAKEKAGADIPF